MSASALLLLIEEYSHRRCAAEKGLVVRKIYCKFNTSTVSYSLPAAGCVPHTLTHLPIPRWEGLYRSRQAHLAVLPTKRTDGFEPAATDRREESRRESEAGQGSEGFRCSALQSRRPASRYVIRDLYRGALFKKRSPRCASPEGTRIMAYMLIE